jgi:hypothetical protein
MYKAFIFMIEEKLRRWQADLWRLGDMFLQIYLWLSADYTVLYPWTTPVRTSDAVSNESKSKGTVKFSLCFITHHAMKTYWGVEV